MRKLTPLQKRFVEIYFSMGKPDKRIAYEKSGYKCRGETARVEAEKTLRKPYVAEYYEFLLSKATENAKLTKSQILKNISRIGTRAERIGEFGTALKAEKLKGDHIGMFKRKHEHTGADGGPISITVTKTYEKGKNVK